MILGFPLPQGYRLLAASIAAPLALSLPSKNDNAILLGDRQMTSKDLAHQQAPLTAVYPLLSLHRVLGAKALLTLIKGGCGADCGVLVARAGFHGIVKVGKDISDHQDQPSAHHHHAC